MNIHEPWLSHPDYRDLSPGLARASWLADGRRYANNDDVPPPDREPDGPREGDEILPAIPRHAADSAVTKNFTPTAIDDVEVSAAPSWLIDGLLPARGLACVVGPPKSRKSFLTSDMLFHVAMARAYAGRAVMPGPVFYLTGEGISGFKRRLVAMRRHHQVEGQGAPFFMVENVPDLGSVTSDLPQLLTALDRFIDAGNIGRPRAIVLDTLARCMGEGDESAARDMGRFANRCSLIERHFGCVVVVVHHMGKDVNRGARGSNALNGAVDVTFTVEKSDAFSTVTVTEMKDGVEGIEWRFGLNVVDLGATSDTPTATTSEVSTCVVQIITEPKLPQPSAQPLKKPTGLAGDLLDVIRRAFAEKGEPGIAPSAPSAVAISRETLKNYCISMEWQDPSNRPDSFRTMLRRHLNKLQALGHVKWDEHEWIWMPPSATDA